MALQPGSLTEEALAFLREYHLASLTTMRADGSPHVVPVGTVAEATRRLLDHERMRREMAIVTDGHASYLYPPDKGWIRLEPWEVDAVGGGHVLQVELVPPVPVDLQGVGPLGGIAVQLKGVGDSASNFGEKSDVTPRYGDTDSIGFSGLTAGSGTGSGISASVLHAAEQIKERMTARAAAIWGVEPKDVE